MIEVWAKSTGDSSPENGFDLQYPIRAPITAVTVTADRPAPQPPGTTISMTASATGGSSVEFKWWVFTATGWTLIRDWRSAATVTWTPTEASPSGMIEVWARSAGDPGPENGFDLPYPIKP